jgi:ATP-dependent DNA helicase RecG
MIKQCKAQGLPEPEFEEKMGCFVTTIWRDIYSKGYIARFNFNERQEKAIQYVKERGSISNNEYCNLLRVSRKTATNDLVDLVNKNIFESVGTGRRNLRYALRLRKNYAKRSRFRFQ